MLKDKILFIDLDGTLVNHGEMSEVSSANIRAVKSVQKNNGHVVIATGRPIHHVQNIHTQIVAAPELSRYVITLNGAEIYDMVEHKVVKR